jgi:hypothetical protein
VSDTASAVVTAVGFSAALAGATGDYLVTRKVRLSLGNEGEFDWERAQRVVSSITWIGFAVAFVGVVLAMYEDAGVTAAMGIGIVYAIVLPAVTGYIWVGVFGLFFKKKEKKQL